MMEDGNRVNVLIMNAYLKFAYALAIRNKLGDAVKRFCYGCEVDHPQQDNHTCAMYETEEHIDMYFDIILKDLEEENIIESWKELMSTSNVIPLDIQNYYISSNNYLANIKTDQWKEEVHKIVLILSRIE